jgi:tetratricopeptide (TPR) repeat protein
VRVDPVVPTRIFAFDDERAFRELSPEGRFVGWLVPSMRENLVAVLETEGIDAVEIVQHEYVHFLLRNQGGAPLPSWYDEGLSELLSTVAVVDDEIRVGRPPTHRFETLALSPWIPLERVLSARSLDGWSDEDLSLFYAEAWLLVHYLHHVHSPGHAKPEAAVLAALDVERGVRSALTRFTGAIERGATVAVASERAFGMEPRALETALRTYLFEQGARSHAIPTAQVATDIEVALRPLPRAESATRLGWLAIGAGKIETAGAHLIEANEARPDHPRTLAGLAQVHITQGRGIEAQALLERAARIAPESALIRLDLANLHYGRALMGGSRSVRRQLVRARRYYTESRQLDPTIPEAWALQGATYLLRGQNPALGRHALEHAHGMLRSSIEIQLLLAHLYQRMGRNRDARALAEQVESWSHAEYAAGARHVLTALDARPTPEDLLDRVLDRVLDDVEETGRVERPRFDTPEIGPAEAGAWTPAPLEATR